jgi:hypothetical protein
LEIEFRLPYAYCLAQVRQRSKTARYHDVGG